MKKRYLVGCLVITSAVVLAGQQGLTDLQRVELAQTLVRSMLGRLTDKGVTNAKNIVTRLETLKGQLTQPGFVAEPVEPAPAPTPVNAACSPYVQVSVAWDPCQPDGQQTGTALLRRTELSPAQNGGASCDPLEKTEPVTQSCVYVPPPSAAWTFTGDPLSIAAGGTSTLSFTTPTADFHVARINGMTPVWGCDADSCSGSLVVWPTQTTTYTLTSENSNGVKWPSPPPVTVTVSGTVPSPTPEPTPTPMPPPTGGSNAYFDALVARPEFWKAYSFRDPKQLTYKDLGGYSAESSRSGAKLWVTYDATMDAAKVVIPPFMPGCTLTAAVSATDALIPLSCGIVGYWNGGPSRAVRVDAEIMEILATGTAGSTLAVMRGAFGTSAAPHAVGANAQWNTNSLQSQVRVPLGTVDGTTYLFTWDGLWTDSYLLSGLTNHKAFQFGSDGIWLEPQTNFSGLNKPGFSQATDVAVLTARSYAPAADPITPRLSAPTIYPNRWTRFWVQIVQRADDSELMSMWMADEQQPPVQIYRDIPIYARPVSIQDFWLEFNTSTDRYVRGASQRDFVSYVKNFVALRNVADVAALLMQPDAK